MQVVDKYGNTFGQGHLIITSKSGKSKLPVVTVAWGNITGVLANQTDLQDALNLKVPTARTITINGVTQDLTANRTWTISTGITVDTTPITGGTSSRLLFDNAGTVGETSGINWNSSTATLSLFDSPFYSQAGNSFANTVFSITGTASSNYTIYSSRQFIFNTGQSMYFNTDTDGGSALDRAWYFAGARTGITGGRTYGALTVNSSGFPSFTLYNNDNGARILLASNATSYFNGGNLLVGTTTDAGYKLDVNGTARVTSLFVGDGSSANPSITFYSENGTPNTGIYRIAENELGIAVGGLTWTFNSGEFKKDQIYLRASAGTATAPNYAFGQGYDSTGMFRPVGENTVAFSTNGTEKMRITGVGNVGIGTSTPSYKLHTVGSAGFDNGASGDAITILNSGYIQSSLIRFRGFSAQFVIQDNSYNTKFVVSTSGSFSYFNTGGNVGINTTTDSGYTLNVNGTGYFNSRVDLSANSPLTLGGGGNNQAGVSLWGTQNASNGWDGWIGRNLEYNGTNYIYKTTNANNYWGTVAGIRTLGTGNLALGFIARPATGEGSNVIATDLNTYTRLAILYNGNVGIGTTTPSAVLHIQSPAGGRSTLVFIRAMNSAAEPAIQFANSANNLAKIGGISGGGLYFENATTELMRISSTGNLLLNTTTDSGYKLDVNGTSIYRESLTNTIGGFLHKSTSTSNDAFWSIVSGSVYFIVSAGGYCKTTSNLVTEATGVGTINASAISQIDSVTKGFLPPRMSNAQMLAIATPAEGLMVYDTTNRKLCCYDGATWQNLF